MFPQIKALPGAECQTTMADRDREINRRQGSPHMRRHVIISLRGVDKYRVPIR